MRLVLALSTLVGCVPADRPGTFVGNPTVEARLAHAPEVPVIGGRLEALGTLLGDCDKIGDIQLGARTIEFVGPLSAESFQIPAGSHCGVFFPVDWFEVEFEFEGVEFRILADDFDLWVPTRFAADPESTHTIRFGDDRWLAGVAAVAPPGESQVNRGNPELDRAFWKGLDESGVEDGAASE